MSLKPTPSIPTLPLSLSQLHQSSNNTPISTPSSSHPTTPFEFRTPATPKKNTSKLTLLLQSTLPNQPLPVPHPIKHLSFTPKAQSKSKPISRTQTSTPKLLSKVYIPNIYIQTNDRRQEEGFSELSSLDNIEMKNEYIKLFQEDLLGVQGKMPEEITFRNKGRISSDKAEGRENQKEKGGGGVEKRKKVSIQFATKSPKYAGGLGSGGWGEEGKLGRTISTVNLDNSHVEREKDRERYVKELINKISTLEIERANDQEKYEIEREEYIKKQQKLVLQIAFLNQTISSLQDKLSLTKQQFEEKSNIYLQQIHQLIIDRQLLEQKLNNTLPPSLPSCPSAQSALLQQLHQKLNYKDTQIFSLESLNPKLTSQIATLSLQLSTTPSPPTFPSSQLSIFQQSLKHSLLQLSRYKHQLLSKTAQISQLKQTHLTTKSQSQRIKNELAIQQLMRITEIQTLKTTFEAERVSKTNQITDLTQEVELLKGRVKSLAQEVKEKDEFIMARIKGV